MGPVAALALGPPIVLALAAAEPAPSATLRIAVREEAGGRPLPARLTVLRPDGEDAGIALRALAGRAAAAGNRIALDAGEARVAVPPGKYRLIVTRGTAYGFWTEVRTLEAGAESRVRITLRRELDVPDLAWDMHLAGAPERWLEARAEGIDRVVAAGWDPPEGAGLRLEDLPWRQAPVPAEAGPFPIGPWARMDPPPQAVEILDGAGDAWRRPWRSLASTRAGWFELLARGIRAAAVAGSGPIRGERPLAGFPRTYLRGDPAEAIARGRTCVSAGIHVEVDPADGPAASGGDGRPLVRAVDGVARLRVRVRAARWIAVDTLSVAIDGEDLLRYRIYDRGEVLREDRIVEIRPRADAWVVVYARGGRPLPPFMPQRIRPIGIAGPIWIDRDGDGRFLPLRARAGQVLSAYRYGPDRMLWALDELPPLARAQAAELLGSRGSEDAFTLLACLLDDREARVRDRVIGALWGAEDPRALAVLGRAFRRKKHPLYERTAAWLARARAYGLEELAERFEKGRIAARREAAVLLRIARPGVEIAEWEVLGPFPDPDLLGVRRRHGPEGRARAAAVFRDREGRIVPWRKARAQGARVPLRGNGGAAEGSVSFACGDIEAARDAKVLAFFAAERGGVLWIDGREIVREEGIGVVPHAVAVPLAAGRHGIIVEAAFRGERGGCEVRWIDPSGALRAVAAASR